MHNLVALGFTHRSYETRRHEHSYEVREELRLADHTLVAWFSAFTRESNGEERLTTQSEFIQHQRLSLLQIRAANQWLLERAQAAPWRLSSYTQMVGAAA